MSKFRSSGTGSIQPWHIVVFVVAGLLVVWQLSKMAVSTRTASDYKVIKGNNAPTGPVAEPLTPGQGAPLSNASPNVVNKVLKDKDSDSDD